MEKFSIDKQLIKSLINILIPIDVFVCATL